MNASLSKTDLLFTSDQSKITSILQLMRLILERNASQHRRRKYFRMCTQLNKKLIMLLNSLSLFPDRFTGRKSVVCDENNEEQYQHLSVLKCELANVQSFCLVTLYQLKCYLANCEFVKVLVTLISLVSDFYEVITQKLSVVFRLINMLSLTGSKTEIPIIEVSPQLSNLQIILSNEADLIEDLGEEVIDNFPSSPKHTDNKYNCSDDNTDKKLNYFHEPDQQAALSPLTLLPPLSLRDNCSKMKTEHQKNSFIKLKKTSLKCPTYKVYKQKSQFLRKLSRYSSDYFRQRLPGYSFSLLLSL